MTLMQSKDKKCYICCCIYEQFFTKALNHSLKELKECRLLSFFKHLLDGLKGSLKMIFKHQITNSKFIPKNFNSNLMMPL